jgi:hypothetical protein
MVQTSVGLPRSSQLADSVLYLIAWSYGTVRTSTMRHCPSKIVVKKLMRMDWIKVLFRLALIKLTSYRH